MCGALGKVMLQVPKIVAAIHHLGAKQDLIPVEIVRVLRWLWHHPCTA